jgi:hypothetical protein
LYVRAAHEEGHEGAVATLHRSRRKVWVTNGRALANLVRARCTECRLKTKKCMEQRMGHLPNQRVGIGAIFQSVAVDLFGPIEYQGTVNKRQVGKGWGVDFVCTTTSAVHIEFVDTYSTESFLMALRRFMCFRGTPSRFQSDRGEQLVTAAKQVSSWDFKEVIQWTGKKGIEWILVPTGGQHFNGQAERMIGLIKKQIRRSFEGRKYSHEETITILQEAAQVINGKPLGLNPWPEGEPLCPQDLLLGRAHPGQPEVKFETGRQLTRRFENVQRAKEEFWGRWIREVFPGLLKQTEWTRNKMDVKIGDIVLRKDETAAGQTYKYTRVIKVHVGTDGRVRAADIEYRLPGETRYRTTTRPIHKMVLIIPVEEQIVGGSEEEAKKTGPEARNPEVMDGNEAQKTKGDEAPQAKDITKDDPLSTKGAKEKPTQKIWYKKVNPRKKAGKQSRTIIVTVPTKSEEIKDAGTTAKRKRERPRKLQRTNSSDPCKGSVLDPGEGVCADPRRGVAILGIGGPAPPKGDDEHQLSPDRGGEKT